MVRIIRRLSALSSTTATLCMLEAIISREFRRFRGPEISADEPGLHSSKTLRRSAMLELGYALSSEEFSPNQLVRLAQRAEQAGFSFALISDHYHPWTSKQGQSPFVWSVIGAIAATTKYLRLGTGVTCPTLRIHPAIISHAAATAAALMPGRF